MSKLLTVYDDKEPLNNVICPLTLDVDEIFYIYHHEKHNNSFTNIKNVINKYKDTKISFIKLENDKEEIERIINQNKKIIIDVGGSKYLSLLLFELANQHNNKIIYYDNTENVIKDYKLHKIIKKDVFKLKIEDVLKLRGGEIQSYMHRAVSDQKSKDIIIETVERNLDEYPSFVRFVSKINSMLNKNNYIRNNTYKLKDTQIKSIITDPIYSKAKSLFSIKDNTIIFKTKTIRELACVSGSFLENYLYIKLKNSKQFDDIKMSVDIDFSDDKYQQSVKCEIDCLVLKNNKMLFVSCKSSKADTQDLNEIYVHNSRFGNTLSSPVMCVLEEMDDKYPGIYVKAEELGVYMIDKSSFIDDKLSEHFLNIFDETYSYDIVPIKI